MKLYIPENQQAPDEFIQIDVTSPEFETFNASDESIISSFVSDAYLKTPAHVHGIVISLLGKKYPLVSAVSGSLDFFGSAMDALSDAIYDATYKQFKLFATLNYTKCPKTVSTIYEAQLYKKFSLLKMFISLKEFKSTSTSKINFQFRITTVGSQYNQNTTMDVNTIININKSI